ncbi:DASH complex subunit dam1, partial [Ascosphaera atra]
MESKTAISGVTRPRSPHHRSLSRPATPLRPSSRSSIRSGGFAHYGGSSTGGGGVGPDGIAPPAINALESQFAELADLITDLEVNFMHLQLMHESLSRFNENFSSFLYGMNMNAFCVDFPEAPIPVSYERANASAAAESATTTDTAQGSANDRQEFESTFMTTDTSFIENPQPTAPEPLVTQTKTTSSTRRRP